MTDLREIDELLAQVEKVYALQRPPDALLVIRLMDVVKEYRDLLANRTEVDLESLNAAIEVFDPEVIGHRNEWNANWLAIYDAARAHRDMLEVE